MLALRAGGTKRDIRKELRNCPVEFDDSEMPGELKAPVVIHLPQK